MEVSGKGRVKNVLNMLEEAFDGGKIKTNFKTEKIEYREDARINEKSKFKSVYNKDFFSLEKKFNNKFQSRKIKRKLFVKPWWTIRREKDFAEKREEEAKKQKKFETTVKNIINCVFKKKKNNIFATLLEKDRKTIIFEMSCGQIDGVSGSKKLSVVTAEDLGRLVFVKLVGYGFKDFGLRLVLRRKVDKFLRAFMRGFFLYAQGEKREIVISGIKLFKKISHNGIRKKKLRRV